MDDRKIKRICPLEALAECDQDLSCYFFIFKNLLLLPMHHRNGFFLHWHTLIIICDRQYLRKDLTVLYESISIEIL